MPESTNSNNAVRMIPTQRFVNKNIFNNKKSSFWNQQHTPIQYGNKNEDFNFRNGHEQIQLLEFGNAGAPNTPVSVVPQLVLFGGTGGTITQQNDFVFDGTKLSAPLLRSSVNPAQNGSVYFSAADGTLITDVGFRYDNISNTLFVNNVEIKAGISVENDFGYNNPTVTTLDFGDLFQLSTDLGDPNKVRVDAVSLNALVGPPTQSLFFGLDGRATSNPNYTFNPTTNRLEATFIRPIGAQPRQVFYGGVNGDLFQETGFEYLDTTNDLMQPLSITRINTGQTAFTSATNSIAIGQNTRSVGINSSSVGSGIANNGTNGQIFGRNITVNQNDVVAFGDNITRNAGGNTNNVLLGRNLTGNALLSVGYDLVNTNGLVFGQGRYSSFSGMGHASTVTATNGFGAVKQSNITGADQGVAFGYGITGNIGVRGCAVGAGVALNANNGDETFVMAATGQASLEQSLAFHGRVHHQFYFGRNAMSKAAKLPLNYSDNSIFLEKRTRAAISTRVDQFNLSAEDALDNAQGNPVSNVAPYVLLETLQTVRQYRQPEISRALATDVKVNLILDYLERLGYIQSSIGLNP